MIAHGVLGYVGRLKQCFFVMTLASWTLFFLSQPLSAENTSSGDCNNVGGQQNIISCYFGNAVNAFSDVSSIYSSCLIGEDSGCRSLGIAASNAERVCDEFDMYTRLQTPEVGEEGLSDQDAIDLLNDMRACALITQISSTLDDTGGKYFDECFKGADSNQSKACRESLLDFSSAYKDYQSFSSYLEIGDFYLPLPDFELDYVYPTW